jgi:hypothetical protein
VAAPRLARRFPISVNKSLCSGQRSLRAAIPPARERRFEIDIGDVCVCKRICCETILQMTFSWNQISLFLDLT